MFMKLLGLSVRKAYVLLESNGIVVGKDLEFHLQQAVHQAQLLPPVRYYTYPVIFPNIMTPNFAFFTVNK